MKIGVLLCLPLAVLLFPPIVFAANAAAVPEMNKVITAIHQDLMKFKPNIPFLADYTDSCLSNENGRAVIHYNPKEKEDSGPQPQQSSHITISYVEIGHAPKNEKYWNVFEDAAACQFPAYGQKIYGEVLAWRNKKDEGVIQKAVADECHKQQELSKKTHEH